MLSCLHHVLLWLWGWMVYILPAISNLILILLGVLMSLPALAEKIEKTPKYRIWLAAICFTAGIIGFGFDVAQRRGSDQSNKQLLQDTGTALKRTDDLVGKTNSLVASTSQMVNTFSILMPQINALHSRIASLETKIEAAKGNPQLVAALQAQATEAKAQASTLSRTILLSLAPGILAEMQSSADKWDMDDNDFEMSIARNRQGNMLKSEQEIRPQLEPIYKARANMNVVYNRQVLPIMTSANYLRLQLVESSGQTAEDKKNTVIFDKVLAGQPITWHEMKQVAMYMENLVERFSQPSLALPSQPQVTAK